MSRAGLASVLAVAGLLLSACGSEPEPLIAMQPDAPADLCATVPQEAKAGLQSSSDADTTGDPTAACSLRSAPGAKPEVHGVVTWLQLDDDGSADGVLASQCRAIDRAVYRAQPDLAVSGADKACGGSGRLGQADSATLAAVSGRTVVTVRWSTLPAQSAPAIGTSRQVMEAVLGSVTGKS